MKLFNRLAFDLVYFFWMLLVVIWVGVQLCSAADPLKVAVIDTGLDRNDPRFEGKLCATGHYNFVDHNEDTSDLNGHGTYVAGLIKKYSSSNISYCLIIYKFYGDGIPGPTNSLNAILAIRAAIKEGAAMVNMSVGGPEFQEQEYLAIKEAPGVLFVVAAGNDSKELKAPYNFYPASYGLKNIVVVGALTHSGKRLDASNYGKLVKAWEQGIGPLAPFPNGTIGTMVGTSIATAIYTGRLISVRGIKK
jgi:subtilisin family serine protease